MDLAEILSDYIPTDHSRQVHVRDELIAYLAGAPAGLTLLDLGCGDGRALALTVRHGNAVAYHGIDIKDSPEVRSRMIGGSSFQTYDGINIPYPDNSFDVVYSCSVLEHVRHPEPLLRDVARVLKSGGIFMGSVSFLEPFHSYSLFNFTPYGIVTVMTDNHLRVEAIRPGIDGLTLTARSLGGRRLYKRFFHAPSPVNRLIDIAAKVRRKSTFWANATKLRVAGHLVFTARKAAAS